ncbi:MAG: CHAT domain-containing protein [Cyanobacteria bacterium J06623_7]
MAIATVIIIFLFNLHSVKSQEVALTAIDDADIVDLQVISERVARLEARWENDYEGYFNRNFANQSRSAGRIAKHLKEIRERAQVNPAVIWAMPQKDFLQLMLITPERQFVIKQIRGANRLRLDSRIKELQLGIEDRQSLAYLPPARIIYSWLFEPLEPYLQAEQIDTLLLCTGPKLRSLPFAVLHDGEQFMVEKYNLARIPAFGLTDTSYAPKPDKQVLAMGTSEFDDFPSLPGVTVELETIVPKLWTGSRITEEDFTIANLQQARQQQNFDIVHIASHSVFRTGKPEKSFIQFSDRKLTLAQLAELDFDLPQVDLLVLSACETALGDESAEYGFAGLAMQAGVKSALASLWLIDDVGTVLLMSDFYQQLQYTPIKSAALRQAQLNLLHQQVTVDDQQIKGLKVKVDLSNISPVLQEQDFSHPYYWGGFTLIGNPW